MTEINKKIKVLGKKVLVEKERLDAGPLKMTAVMELEGQKNVGVITAVGQIGFLAKLRGVRVGATIYFKKFFICNDGQKDASAFVDVESICGVKS